MQICLCKITNSVTTGQGKRFQLSEVMITFKEYVPEYVQTINYIHSQTENLETNCHMILV